MPRIWRGVILNAPATFSDLAQVVIPDLHSAMSFQDVRWTGSVLPEEGDDCLIIFDNQRRPWIVASSPQEIVPGAGGGGDKNYVHNQGTPAPNWTVTHSLGKFPSVEVVDSGNNVLIPDVHYVDLNTVALAFGSATSGKAYVN